MSEISPISAGLCGQVSLGFFSKGGPCDQRSFLIVARQLSSFWMLRQLDLVMSPHIAIGLLLTGPILATKIWNLLPLPYVSKNGSSRLII